MDYRLIQNHSAKNWTTSNPPIAIAAQMMGHSIAIHTQTYHHWIGRRDRQQAVDAAFDSKLLL
jgi:integrase